MKNYDLYRLREEGAEAGSMTALKPFVLLDRAHLLEEVGKFGFMCDWNDFKVSLCRFQTGDPPQTCCYKQCVKSEDLTNFKISRSQRIQRISTA